MFNYRSNLHVQRFQNWEPTSIEQVREFIEKYSTNLPNTPGTWYQLGIRKRDTGKLIGDCGLHFPSKRLYEVEFGITIAPEYQGQGFAAESIRAIFSYLFETLEKHRVYASVDPRNLASVRLMESLGMRMEAHFRESIWFKGEWADDVVFSILRREWAKIGVG